MQVGALNFGLWLDLRRMIVVHDRCQGEIQKEIQGIFGRGSGEMRREIRKEVRVRFGTVRSLLRCCMHT